MTTLCESCKKPLTGKQKTICNKCCVVRARRVRKIKALEYKGGMCGLCGFSKCVRALTFHHRDPSKKEIGIGSGSAFSWKRVVVELDKCDLLCMNCHATLHCGCVAGSCLDTERPPARTKPIPGICKWCDRRKVSSASSSYCSRQCSSRAARRVDRPAKSVLRRMLKTQSYEALGRQFGVTGAAVKKWLK